MRRTRADESRTHAVSALSMFTSSLLCPLGRPRSGSRTPPRVARSAMEVPVDARGCNSASEGRRNVADRRRCRGSTDHRQFGRKSGAGQDRRVSRRGLPLRPFEIDENVRTTGHAHELVPIACGPRERSLECHAMAKRIADTSAEARRLATLFEVSQALSGRGELKPSLQRVLEKLERDQGLVRGAVMLLSEDTRDIHIESALGFGPEGQAARYKLGEGITGRVVESGRPIVVPAVSREPLFLNRAFQRKRPGIPETTFVCVPIVLDRKPVSALAVDLDYDQPRDYDRAQEIFAAVAGMIVYVLRRQRYSENWLKLIPDGDE